jgi:hypothetical protein
MDAGVESSINMKVTPNLYFVRDFETLMSEECQSISSSHFAAGDHFLLAGLYELDEE